MEWELCPVVDDDGIVLGAIRPDALDGEAGARAEEVMDPAPITFRPDLPAEQILEWLSSRDRTSAAVTTPEGRLLGVIITRRLETAVRVGAGTG